MDASQQDTFEPRFSNFFDDLFSGGSAPMALYAAKVKRTSDQAGGGASVINTVSFDTEIFDYGGFFDIASPEILTVPTGLGGIYSLTANISMDSAAGVRHVKVWIEINGAEIVAMEGEDTNTDITYSLSTNQELQAGDIIRLKWDSGTGNRDLKVNYIDTSLSIVKYPDGT